MLEKKGLIKLTEECGELIQIASKKMTCMGVDIHYDGSSLSMRMEEEIGDVLAAARIVIENFNLNEHKIGCRVDEKYQLFLEWMKEK